MALSTLGVLVCIVAADLSEVRSFTLLFGLAFSLALWSEIAIAMRHRRRRSVARSLGCAVGRGFCSNTHGGRASPGLGSRRFHADIFGNLASRRSRAAITKNAFPPLPGRRGPSRKQDSCFIVRQAPSHALAHVYFEEDPGRRAAATPTDPRRGPAHRRQHRQAVEPPRRITRQARRRKASATYWTSRYSFVQALVGISHDLPSIPTPGTNVYPGIRTAFAGTYGRNPYSGPYGRA